MLFPFHSFVAPGWWYHLAPSDGTEYFVDYRQLGSDERALIDFDEEFESEYGALADAAYQAWEKGIMRRDPAAMLSLESGSTSLKDNYRFLRRHFHPAWSGYVLLLRLLSLNNPAREIAAFLSQRSVQRLRTYDSVFPNQIAYDEFSSSLLEERPLVSVVIPTLNRYSLLRDVLHDLEAQDHLNFEVIVVDQTEDFDSEFYSQFQLDIKLIRQEEKALWLARNTAVLKAKGELLLLFDDDSRVGRDWISHHIKALDCFDAEISSGVSFSKVGAKIPANYSFFRWGDQIDTGNVMIRRRVFEDVGMFDRQFERQRMGDGEFGVRSFLAGFRNVSNPLASRLHLKAEQGGLRQMGSWDGFRPTSWLAPRPVPSVLYLLRKYFGDRAALMALLIGVPPSILPYKYKGQTRLLLLGSLVVVPLFPLVVYQVVRSWCRSSEMLSEGFRR